MNINIPFKRTIAAVGIASLLAVSAVAAQDATPPVAPMAEVRPERANIIRDLLLEYTGLDAAGVRTAIEGGATLASLIEANGMSVDDFVVAALAAHDAQVAERRTAFETNLTAILNGEVPAEGLGGGRGGFGRFGGLFGDHDGMGGGRGGRGDGMGGGRGGRGGQQPPMTGEAPAAEATAEAGTTS